MGKGKPQTLESASGAHRDSGGMFACEWIFNLVKQTQTSQM